MAACTDTDEDPKPPWEERKRHHLRAMPTAPEGALLILLADKVYNLSRMLADEKRLGSASWKRFKAPRDQQLWYFQEVYAVLSVPDGPEDPAPGAIPPPDRPTGRRPFVAAAVPGRRIP